MAAYTTLLRLTKNKFPEDITRYLFTAPDLKNEQDRIKESRKLKFWYQSCFKKGNRWNRTLLYSLIKTYTEQELLKLKDCFVLLFDINRKYNQIFIRYVDTYMEQQEAQKLGLSSIRLKVGQETYQEILRYFGDLKRDGKIKNSNREIAQILRRFLDPDISLAVSTIIDRLKNKKGYY